jgi:periplasmic protein TonB
VFALHATGAGTGSVERQMIATVRLVMLLCALWLVSPLVAQVHPERVRMTESASQKLILKKVRPLYPEEARKKGIQGSVALSVRIGKSGDVINMKLVSGDPALAPAAIEAVKRWKYKPFLIDGNALEVDTQVTVNFTLTEK